jgi:putative peptide zinc metalloprotease protein
MSATIERVSAEGPLEDATAAYLRRPTLLPGTELMGRFEGSGLREPPYLISRCDGQVVQVSHLLYVIASCMDGRNLVAIANSAGERLDLRIRPEQIAYVAEHKLAPLGLVAHHDGSMPTLERRNALLALKFRAGLVPARTANAIAGLLRPLFWSPLVIVTMATLLLFDVWLAISRPHGFGRGLQTVIANPSLALALFAIVVLSLAFHECGHAAACRYGGARPGRIGVGIYLVWPVFYSDVTDSYRLSKTGRLRTDLGGIYFNGLVALTTAGAYLATAYQPLLVVVVTQQILILDQFLPWLRLDGYHIVSDLIGISDLFTRIKPVIVSLLPGRHPDPRVTELKTWVRAAVTAWVLTTVVALTGMLVLIVVNLPAYLTRGWQSLIVQVDAVAHGAQIGSVVALLNGAIGAVMLVIPLAGLTLSYLLLCRGLGAALALRHTRRD